MLDAELFSFLENTTDAAFTVSEQGEIRSWNKAAERLFGFPAKEVLGRTCYQVLEGMGPLGTQVGHENCSLLECAGGKGQIPNFDLSVRVHSGDRRWINMSTLVYGNQRTGRRLLVHLAHDITEQKKTEQLVQKVRCFSRQLDEEESLPLGRPAPVISLSEQEKQILRLFAEGKESEQITEFLGISSTDRSQPSASHQSEATHAQSSGGGNACHPEKADLKG